MYEFTIFSALSVFIGAIYMFLTIHIFLRNPKSLVNRLFALVGLTMFLWGVGEGLQRAAVDEHTSLFWANYIGFFGACFHAPTYLHFWLEFSGQIEKLKRKWYVAGLYIPFLIFWTIILYDSNLLVTGVVKNYWGNSVEIAPLYNLYALSIAIYIIIGAVLAFKKAKHSDGNLKKSSRDIGIAIVCTLVLGISTQIIGPALHVKIPELSVASALIFVSFVAHAVIKYGLLSITTKIVADNIIGTMEDYVIAIDKNMNIAFVNEAALKAFGYREKELMKKPISSVLSGDDIFKFNYEEALEHFPMQAHQSELEVKKGKKIAVSGNISVLKEKWGEAIGFVFVFRDMGQINQLITGLEESKKELEVSKKDLESKVEELDRFNKIAVNRELQIIKLKEKVQLLRDGKEVSDNDEDIKEEIMEKDIEKDNKKKAKK